MRVTCAAMSAMFRRWKRGRAGGGSSGNAEASKVAKRAAEENGRWADEFAARSGATLRRGRCAGKDLTARNSDALAAAGSGEIETRIAEEPEGVGPRNVQERVGALDAVDERRKNDREGLQSAGLITC